MDSAAQKCKSKQPEKTWSGIRIEYIPTAAISGPSAYVSELPRIWIRSGTPLIHLVSYSCNLWHEGHWGLTTRIYLHTPIQHKTCHVPQQVCAPLHRTTLATCAFHQKCTVRFSEGAGLTTLTTTIFGHGIWDSHQPQHHSCMHGHSMMHPRRKKSLAKAHEAHEALQKVRAFRSRI